MNGGNQDEVQDKGLQAHLGLQPAMGTLPGGGSGNVTGNTIGQQRMKLGNRGIVGQSGEGRTGTGKFGQANQETPKKLFGKGDYLG